jgi:hypothetical protein
LYLQVASCKCELQVTSELQAAKCEVQAAKFKLQVASGYKSATSQVKCKLQVPRRCCQAMV